MLVCFSSTYKDGQLETHAFALPTVRGYFSGVGDLFSALVLGHYQRPEGPALNVDPLVDAVSRSLLTVQQILLRTHLYSLNVAASGTATPRPLHESAQRQELPPDSVIPSDTELDDAPPLNPSDPKRKARRMRLRELRIIPERKMITNTGQGWPGVRIDWNAVNDEKAAV